MSPAARFVSFALPPIALAGAIFVLSSQESLGGPGFFGSDKVAHFCAYALLAFLTARALWHYGQFRSARWGGALVAIAYGVSDEFHQSFVPGRTSDWRDLVADAIGAAVGASLYVYAVTRRASQ